MYGDNKINNETDGDPISKTLGELSRVSAPASFEQDVLREIRTRAAVAQTPRFQWLKIAVPAGALAVLAAFFGMSGFWAGEIPTIAVVNEHKLERPSLDPVGSGSNIAGNGVAVSTSGTNVNAKGSNSQTTAENPAASSEEANRSTTLAVEPADAPKRPKGLTGDSSTVTDRRGVDGTRKVRLIEIVEMLGVRVAFQNGTYVAVGISETGPAKTAGVRAGDVIEAVNDVSLSDTATLSGQNDVRSIRIRRDGRSITLKL